MSRYATDVDLLARISAASAATADQRALALEDATAAIDLVAYGAQAVRAHCFLAAHYLAIGGFIAGGGSGVVASHAAGAISASYAVGPGPSDPFLASTQYGREFLRIRSSLVGQPFTSEEAV